MPTLLQINTVANQGSTGHIAEAIGRTALSQGWRCVMAYGRGTPKSEMELWRIGSDADMYAHALHARLFDSQGLCSRTATKRLIKRMEALKPDIVHLHLLHGYYINYPLLFAYLAEKDIPVVWTMHDEWAITGHCATLLCDGWRSGCNGCAYHRQFPASWLLDRSPRNFRLKVESINSVHNLTIITPSNWLADIIRQSHLGNHHIVTIHNGIDLSVFSPSTPEDTLQMRSQLGIVQPNVILGVASIWGPDKGLPDFTTLRQLLPIDKYAIVLVGLSDAQLSHLPEGIIGIKHTESQRQLATLYTLANVFVNPTYLDNFPTTNVEALACGTPIITYHTGGSVEAVSPDTGRVVGQGNVSALAQTISELTAAPKNADACRRRAVENYDKKKILAQHMSLYNKLLESRHL